LEFELLKQEKESKHTEMLDYNKRLDRTVVLYLSAAYAAIGLQATGRLDLSAGLNSDMYVLLVVLFIFLNGCILLHGISQSCWSMSLAKFIHLKLDMELLTKAGVPVQDRCNKSDLIGADALGWDDWRIDIKGLANANREKVVALWALLVCASSVLSLKFVDVPHFISCQWNGGWIGVSNVVLFALAIPLLLAIYSYAAYEFALEYFDLQHYHDLRPTLTENDRSWALRISLITAFVLLAFSYLSALTHFKPEKAPNATPTTAVSGVGGPKGTDPQPGNATVPARPGDRGDLSLHLRF
jgi:hypothetical protein